MERVVPSSMQTPFVPSLHEMSHVFSEVILMTAQFEYVLPLADVLLAS